MDVVEQTLTPEMFGGSTYEGVTVEQVGDDGERYVALGHVDPVAFSSAARQHAVHLCGEIHASDPEDYDPDFVQHAWAVLNTDPGDKDWCICWGGVTEATPRAFPITMLELG